MVDLDLEVCFFFDISLSFWTDIISHDNFSQNERIGLYIEGYGPHTHTMFLMAVKRLRPNAPPRIRVWSGLVKGQCYSTTLYWVFISREVHQAGYVMGNTKLGEGNMVVICCNTPLQHEGVHLKRKRYVLICQTGCFKFTEKNTVPLVLQFRANARDQHGNLRQSVILVGMLEKLVFEWNVEGTGSKDLEFRFAQTFFSQLGQPPHFSVLNVEVKQSQTACTFAMNSIALRCLLWHL